MKVNDLIVNNLVLNNIPFEFEGRELSMPLQAKLMILKVSYRKEVRAIQERLDEIIDCLKPLGYDSLYLKVERMKYLESIENPTNDELKEAECIRNNEFKDFESKKSVLDEKIGIAYQQIISEDTYVDVKGFTNEEYTEIYSMIGPKGTIPYENGEAKYNVLRIEFLNMIAERLIK